MIALAILLTCWPSAFALDPSLDVNQYAHTAWKLSEGFSKGIILSIAQTPDGYLWLGTEFGLLRFDGVRAVPWQPPSGEHLPSSDITSVRVTRDGALWIGTAGGLVSWKAGKLTHYPAFGGLIIEALLEDREGTIWVLAGRALPESRLCSVQKEKTHCYGEDRGAGFGITSIYEDSRGVLWAGGMKGVWRWNPGPPKFYPMAGPEERTYGLTETDDGGILIARRGGITKLRNGKFERYPFPAGLRFSPSKLLRDRDGGLWIGALVDQGLLHIHQGKTDLFTPPEGVFGDLSGHQVRRFFEDREGSIWVSTPSGLDRFREFAIPAVSVPQGLSSRGISSVLAGKDGSIWLATSDGLNRWKGGRVEIYRNRGGPLNSTLGGFTTGQFAEPGTTTHEIVDAGFPPQEVTSLFEDEAGRTWVSTLGGVAFLESDRFVPVRSVPPGDVFSIIGDRAENVWMSHEEGLFHLQQARLMERISWAKLGRKEPASALLHDPVQGGLWLGFHDGGVTFFKAGQLRAYAGPQGLAEGMVHSFYSDGSGALWVATVGGLSRIKDDRILTLTSRNGLPCNNVHWMMEDDFHSVWLYTACGLVRMGRSELDAWVSGSKHVTQLTVFDTSDGVRIYPNLGRESPLVAKATDGRLWFTAHDGVSIIDPRHLAYNKLPPPVHIEQIIADDKTYDPVHGVHLPALVRNLTIDYTALSLVAPEKIHFRYMLEGQDRDWREVVNDRKVQYSNLPPKHYRFRVTACNNSGVWNEEGATLDFIIPPAWYQTNWFYALCTAAFIALLWAAYRLRVRQLAHEFNMGLEQRVAERTRIARELHDTLLQSFQALLPRLQASINMFPSRPDDARRNLEQAADQASQAIAEGRDAVEGLRTSTIEKNDLAIAVRSLGEELASAAGNTSSPKFNVVVEGTTRNLHPILRDEVYRLAVEALRNGFRHAAAKTIEVEIRYDEKYFRLRVRDDGKGIPSDVLGGDGREGHYGLPGMRERAALVGGKLTIWTELDGGTEIELNIPGAKAYLQSTRPFWYFGKRSATETDEKEPIERE
jgi:signal transduction histidine kinase/ligand-binding sensor domain-containing protein